MQNYNFLPNRLINYNKPHVSCPSLRQISIYTLANPLINNSNQIQILTYRILLAKPMSSFDLFLVLEEIGLSATVAVGWKLFPFENCVAAARAPAMAAVRLADFFGTDEPTAFDGAQTSTDPGFRE